MKLIIDIVRPDEVFTLKDIATRTFLLSFGRSNSNENIDKYLEDRFNKNRLEHELNNAQSQFYFARVNSEVVGYLKVNSGEAQTEQVLDDSLEIERIYVLPSFHGKGIGRALMEKALAIAAEQKYRCVWLGVWEKNSGPVEFYKKFGFKVFGSHTFMLGDDEQVDLLMRLDLV